jgi:hypothetical protein
MSRCYACPKDLGNGGILTENGRLLCPVCEKKEKYNGKELSEYGALNLQKPLLFAIFVAAAELIICIVLFARGPTVVKSTPKEVVREKVVNVPVEVVKEKVVRVPVEVVREKIVEVVKNDPLADDAKLFKSIYFRTLREDFCQQDKVLWNISSLRLHMFIGKKLEDYLDESSLRTDVELRLRNNGVKIDNDSLQAVSFSVEGLWNDSKTVCSFVATVRVREHAIIYRQGVPKKVFVDTWHDARYGYSGSSVIKKSAQEGLTSLADSLANLYLSSNPRN